MNRKRMLKVRKMASLLTMICLLFFASVLPVQAAGQEYQIGVFLAPPWAYTNATQYDWIRDANVNLVQEIYPNGQQMDTSAKINTVLGLASTRGIKVQVADSSWANIMTTSTDADIDTMAATYKNTAGTGGYYVKDEPTDDTTTQRAAHVYQRFLMNDPDGVPMMNMWSLISPDFFTGSKRWIQLVDPSNLKYLTYDDYPYVGNGVPVKVDWYKNLSIIRSLGLSYNIKTGDYLQSTGDTYLRVPNADEVRLETWSSLAYGMKGIYWFTWMQQNGIINDLGVKSSLYTPVQTINGEIMQLSPTFMGLTSRDVYFKGTHYVGTTAVPASYFFNPTAAYDQIISHFANASGRSYIMVVNRDFTNTRTLTFNLPSKLASVTEVSKTTGAEIATNYSSTTGNLSESFLPGEGRLYAISTDFALPAQTVDDKEVKIIYSGTGWVSSPDRNVGDYDDDLHATTVNNDYFQYTFNGTGVDYVTEKESDEGNVDMYIDGVFQQTVSLFNATRLVQQTVYSKTGLANGTHTIKGVKKTGTYMLLDTLKVTSPTITRNAVKTNDTDKGITYSGSGWSYGAGRGVGDYYNDVHATTTNNDYFQYTFTGTGVDYITEKNSDEGDVDVYIDNVLQTTVSCYNATRITQQTVYSMTGLTYGTHTIKVIKKTGTFMLLDGFNENSGSNLIANPGFENGTTSWSVYDGAGSSMAIDTTNKHAGTNGMRSYNRTHLHSSPSQDITAVLKANGIGNYNLSAWIKEAGSDSAQVAIQLTDTSGTHWVSTDFKSVNSTDWVQSQKNVNITWNGDLTSAKVYVQTAIFGYDIYVDDFVLTR